MITMLGRALSWWLQPDPKIGERFVFMDSAKDPWNERFYTVVKKRGNWYRIRSSGGFEESKTKFELVTYYRKTGEAPSDNDEPPF